jgi:hypothetical protein
VVSASFYSLLGCHMSLYASLFFLSLCIFQDVIVYTAMSGHASGTSAVIVVVLDSTFVFNKTETHVHQSVMMKWRKLSHDNSGSSAPDQ